MFTVYSMYVKCSYDFSYNFLLNHTLHHFNFALKQHLQY